MNQFTKVRHKTIAEVAKQCREQRVPHIRGEHAIYVGRPSKGGGNAVYNARNGVFYGTAPNGTKFNSTVGRCDRQEWMQQLRAFFHEEIKE